MIYEIRIINADDVKWIANCLQSTTNGCYCAAALIVEMWLWLLSLCEVLIVDVSLRVWAWWPKVCEWYYVSHRRGSWYCLVSYGIAWYCGWCVSHRRGLRIWGLSSNNASGPRAPYQVPPRVAPPWWELVPLKCLSNILPPASPPVLLEEMLTESKCFSSFPPTLNF